MKKYRPNSEMMCGMVEIDEELKLFKNDIFEKFDQGYTIQYLAAKHFDEIQKILKIKIVPGRDHSMEFESFIEDVIRQKIRMENES